VIRRVGRENILIIATPSKLLSIGPGGPLLVDTGNEETDRMLSGYVRVVTGYQEEVVVKVSS
jgi:predicted polyphosphate/ATP-dependent NAD kinase